MTRGFGWSEFLFVLGGLRWTILLSLAAMGCGGVPGLLVAILRTAPIRPLRWLARGFIELLQGTPVPVSYTHLKSSCGYVSASDCAASHWVRGIASIEPRQISPRNAAALSVSASTTAGHGSIRRSSTTARP